MERSLTIVIPGLFGFRGETADASQISAAALETLLGRAEHVHTPMVDYERQILGLFGVPAPDDADVPVAAITRVLDLGVIDNGWWVRADPVHLRPERDRLILLDTQIVPLTLDEANKLTAELTEAYAGHGWLLKSPRPGRWYLKPPRAARIQTTPLPRVVGKDIHPYLPQGKDGKAWHTLLNEIQILLHTAGVNTEREQRGDLPINSVWFWGGGRLPIISEVEWTHLYSEEPMSLALARLSETPSSALPGGFNDWLRQAPTAGSCLAVLDHARGAVQYRQERGWREVIERLERDWMAPALHALKAREIRELTICADTVTFRIGRRETRRWWRRRRPLAGYR
jgi:hypothetical protein